MKYAVIHIITFLLAYHGTMAQRNLVFDNCNMPLSSLYKGDTIRIACDTAYIMSRSYYTLISSKYTKQSDVQKALIKLQNQGMEACSLEIDRKDRAYEVLKLKFDSLAGRSIEVTKKADLNLQKVNISLDSIDAKITKAQASIENANNYIKQEKKSMFKKNMGWGLTGFLVGVVATVLIVAAVD